MDEYYGEAHLTDRAHLKKEETISKVYPVIDTDLARDNIEIDLPEADKQDL